MSCEFRILDHNYVFQENVTLTASSSGASFPVNNITHYFRSKIWRSSGTFVIGSTNNKLDFAEAVAGPELTATITSGTYTASSLATEIKTQLEAVGANTYTVTHSGSTGKWTIATAGTALELRWQGTNSASSIGGALGYDTSSNQTGATSYTGAEIAIHTEESIIIDLQTIEEIDSVALVFDPLTGIKLSTDAVIRIQANATNVWTSPAVNQLLTLDFNLDVATHFFTADQSYRYWRLLIQDPKNLNLYVEISKIVLSNATILDHGPEIGFKYQINDQSRVSRNEYGHEFSDVYPSQQAFEFNLNVLPFADIETLADIFRRVGNTSPICISLDSTEELFDKDRFFIYGKINGRLTSTHLFYDRFNQDLSIIESM